MYLTEEEARQRWCPYGHQATLFREYDNRGGYNDAAIGGVNRVPQGDVPACLASQCMAWRFATPKPLRDIDLVTSDVVDQEPRRGYCGAFGTPAHGD